MKSDFERVFPILISSKYQQNLFLLKTYLRLLEQMWIQKDNISQNDFLNYCSYGKSDKMCLVEVLAGSKRQSDADSYVVSRFGAPTGYLESLKTTRFTVGFRTLDNTKRCDFAMNSRIP